MKPARNFSRAKYLLAVLRDKQTHSDGRVWYGHAVTYERIATWFGENGPSTRTIRRWMEELRRAGAVSVKYARMRQGMRLQLPLGSARAFRHAQMSMFSEPLAMPRRKEISTGNASFPQGDVRPRVAGACGHGWPEKDLSNNRHAKRLPLASASGIPPADESAKPNGKGENRQQGPKTGKTERRKWTTITAQGDGGSLSEYYALKKYLAKMPRARDPAKWDAMHERWKALADEVEGETARLRGELARA